MVAAAVLEAPEPQRAGEEHQEVVEMLWESVIFVQV